VPPRPPATWSRNFCNCGSSVTGPPATTREGLKSMLETAAGRD
jgi:hypothetical protein